MSTATPIDVFPCNGPQRISVAPQLFKSTARVIFPYEAIPVFQGNFQGFDAQGYYPISAICTEAPGCKLPGCGDAIVFLDDATSRCTWYVNAIKLVAGVPPPPPGPIVIDFAFKAAAAGIGSPVFFLTVVVDFGQTLQGIPIAPGERGLLAVLGGPDATQWEVWARINPALGVAAPLEIRLQGIVHRCCSDVVGWAGPLAVPGNVLPDPCCAAVTGPTGPLGPTGPFGVTGPFLLPTLSPLPALADTPPFPPLTP